MVVTVRVGIRDLRERMSYWLGRAADGEELIVTRHDEPIARITNIDGRTTLDRLIEEGLVTPAKREKRKIRIEDLILARGSVSELLIEDRKRGS